MFILYQTKNQDRSELILTEIQSFQTENVLDGGQIMIKILMLPFQEGVKTTLLHDFLARF